MANIKSQIKRNRQSELARQANRSTRSALKTEIKKLGTALETGDVESARSSYRDVSKALDQAAAKGVIHKNTAAKKKSRLARKLNASGSSS